MPIGIWARLPGAPPTPPSMRDRTRRFVARMQTTSNDGAIKGDGGRLTILVHRSNSLVPATAPSGAACWVPPTVSGLPPRATDDRPIRGESGEAR